MKYCLFTFLVFVILVNAPAQPAWKIVDDKILSPWAAQVSPASVLPKYPRPQMQRDLWLNLNGLWDYRIAPVAEPKPKQYDGEILVPFPAESALSGVARRVGKDNNLWYRRTFRLPRGFNNKTLLLHFGAVDWRCEVFINGRSAGKHEGGYDSFSFDITPFLTRNQDQEIVVSVWDPSDEGPQPRGKQVKDPNSIWYTPVTGIWQTVWLEPVNSAYIANIKVTPDVDRKQVHVIAAPKNRRAGDNVKISVFTGNQKVAEQSFSSDSATIRLDDVKLWSPSSPHLYDLRVSLIRNGKTIDNLKSYFGMRKISVGKDKQGSARLLLNNEILFQYGPLDQGWWPDGLYTAPSDAALRFDIEKTRAMGFNMIRKHVKVEPARWYYLCDSLGILVWQDMPSGDMGNRWDSRPGIIGVASEKERTTESETIFRREWKAIMDATYHFPSIVVWVPFNEAWGQFKTDEIVQWTMKYDPSRLVNAASGGNFTSAGHIFDLHNYPSPAMPDPAIFGNDQVIVLGEFGGLGLPLEGHTWRSKDNWGYQSFSSKEELQGRYEAFMSDLQKLISKGLAAAVYTQTTDVEIETNGLMTYDRKVIKMDANELKKLHDKLYEVE
jgi:beta-galactosidase/beta-glucuronidase